MGPLLEHVIEPIVGSPICPLLAFAMNGAEARQLRRVFPQILSVSLYGNYGASHQEGVDARDLSRYPSGTMGGVFGCLLFDYFSEHAAALRQAFSAVATGGVFFTHIAPYRLVDGMAEPKIVDVVKPREEHFKYLPADGIPSISVGRDWFVCAMTEAGFEATRVAVRDAHTDQTLEWFVGVKPRLLGARRRSLRAQADMTPAFSRTHSIPVDSAHGYKRIAIELSAPSVPTNGSPIAFAEHVHQPEGQTDTVVACTRGALVISEDLGASWNYVPLPELNDVELWNSFTMASGKHLVQGLGAATRGVRRTDSKRDAPVCVLDREWRIVDVVTPGVASWHGTRSIDEASGVTIYGEYPANSAKYVAGFDPSDPSAEELALLHDSRLLRSTDGGHEWSTVLQQDWHTIRHFHTVAADPWQSGRWWASSGDRPGECRAWESLDHGCTWTEIATRLPAGELHPLHAAHAQSVMRYTDVVVSAEDLTWGADDLLGGGSVSDADVLGRRRAGARLFRTSKQSPWEPKGIGYVGNPVRSLIDVGPGYVVITEAKGPLGYCPQVLLLPKAEPFTPIPLMMVDNFAGGPTGFTYSRASHAAKDDVFFTYRLRTDAFPDGAQMLRWRILFD